MRKWDSVLIIFKVSIKQDIVYLGKLDVPFRSVFDYGQKSFHKAIKSEVTEGSNMKWREDLFKQCAKGYDMV